MFALFYYGLFRIGELTLGNHPVKASDVHIAKNKDKMLFILYTSKTHDKSSRPQKVKIQKITNKDLGHFCPFHLTQQYLTLRGDFNSYDEQFFVFSDKMPVKSNMVRQVLKDIISNLNLDSSYFGTHGFRAGRACDLLKLGYSIEKIKIISRWKSNAVYRYLRV